MDMSKSVIRRTAVQGGDVLQVTIRINRRPIYNIIATRTNLEPTTIGNYDCKETVNGYQFKIKNFDRAEGALELGRLMLGHVLDKEIRLK